ncbi:MULTISPECIES: hypothetical protein [unclassified Wolbachia]
MLAGSMLRFWVKSGILAYFALFWRKTFMKLCPFGFSKDFVYKI